MAGSSEIAHLLDVPLFVEATVPGPTLTVSELLALSVGSLITTGRAAGENIEIIAGEVRIGAGELSSANGRAAVRVVRFGGKH
jgi:flagellar motor switch/type III secretory pathway protein FliN